MLGSAESEEVSLISLKRRKDGIRGRVRAGPSFQLGTLSTRIASRAACHVALRALTSIYFNLLRAQQQQQ